MLFECLFRIDGWLAGLLSASLAGWLAAGLADWLAGCWLGWLAGWLDGLAWLADFYENFDFKEFSTNLIVA